MNDSTVLLAKAVDSSVWDCLLRAMREPEKEGYWFAHADKLERKLARPLDRPRWR